MINTHYIEYYNILMVHSLGKHENVNKLGPFYLTK